MLKPITLVYKDGRLAPETGEDDAGLRARFGVGEVVVTELRPHIDQPRLGEFWALIGKALPQLPQWGDPADLADAVKIATGWRTLCVTIRGKPYFRTRSLSEIRDWDHFLQAVVRVLTEELKLDERSLRKDPGQAEAVAPPDEPKGLSRGAATPAVCLTKFLELAVDPAFADDLLEHRQAAIRKLTKQWEEAMPAHANFARKCGVTCLDVADGRMTLEAARKLLQAQLPK